jgi:hypothetical protein
MSDEGMRELTDLEKMLKAECRRSAELLELAWGLIANAGGGDWGRETGEWKEAAQRWRADYFKAPVEKHPR